MYDLGKLQETVFEATRTFYLSELLKRRHKGPYDGWEQTFTNILHRNTLIVTIKFATPLKLCTKYSSKHCQSLYRQLTEVSCK